MAGVGDRKMVTESVTGGYIPQNPTVGWMRQELTILGKISTGQTVKESEMISMLVDLGYPIRSK